MHTVTAPHPLAAGALVHSRNSLEAFLRGLPQGSCSSQALHSLRSLVAHQGGQTVKEEAGCLMELSFWLISDMCFPSGAPVRPVLASWLNLLTQVLL
jgi:hypothetical protein